MEDEEYVEDGTTPVDDDEDKATPDDDDERDEETPVDDEAAVEEDDKAEEEEDSAVEEGAVLLLLLTAVEETTGSTKVNCRHGALVELAGTASIQAKIGRVSPTRGLYLMMELIPPAAADVKPSLASIFPSFLLLPATFLRYQPKLFTARTLKAYSTPRVRKICGL